MEIDRDRLGQIAYGQQFQTLLSLLEAKDKEIQALRDQLAAWKFLATNQRPEPKQEVYPGALRNP